MPPSECYDNQQPLLLELLHIREFITHTYLPLHKIMTIFPYTNKIKLRLKYYFSTLHLHCEPRNYYYLTQLKYFPLLK